MIIANFNCKRVRYFTMRPESRDKTFVTIRGVLHILQQASTLTQCETHGANCGLSAIDHSAAVSQQEKNRNAGCMKAGQ